MHIVFILFFALALVVTLVRFFVQADEPNSYFWGAICLLIFGFAIRKFGHQALHCISCRLEVGDQWIATRDFFSLDVIPFFQAHRLPRAADDIRKQAQWVPLWIFWGF